MHDTQNFRNSEFCLLVCVTPTPKQSVSLQACVFRVVAPWSGVPPSRALLAILKQRWARYSFQLVSSVRKFNIVLCCSFAKVLFAMAVIKWISEEIILSVLSDTSVGTMDYTNFSATCQYYYNIIETTDRVWKPKFLERHILCYLSNWFLASANVLHKGK